MVDDWLECPAERGIVGVEDGGGSGDDGGFEFRTKARSDFGRWDVRAAGFLDEVLELRFMDRRVVGVDGARGWGAGFDDCFVERWGYTFFVV